MATDGLNDPALQEYYEALFLMYGSRGWSKLMEDLGRMRQTHDSLVGIETQEQLWYRKGQINQMEWMLSHRDAGEHAYHSLLEDQSTTPPEAPTGGRATIVNPNAEPE